MLQMFVRKIELINLHSSVRDMVFLSSVTFVFSLLCFVAMSVAFSLCCTDVLFSVIQTV